MERVAQDQGCGCLVNPQDSAKWLLTVFSTSIFGSILLQQLEKLLGVARDFYINSINCLYPQCLLAAGARSA